MSQPRSREAHCERVPESVGDTGSVGRVLENPLEVLHKHVPMTNNPCATTKL